MDFELSRMIEQDASKASEITKLSNRIAELEGARPAFINCGTVCCVLIKVEDGLILIQRGNPEESGYGEFALPGGFQEGAISEPVRVVAAREVNEELGIVIDPDKLSLINVETDDYGHNVIFWEYTYPGYWTAFQVQMNPDPTEVMSVQLIRGPTETCYPFHTEEVRKFFIRHGDHEVDDNVGC